MPGAAANGTTYPRFRCSTQQNLTPVGVSTDGEVEDYAVTVTGTAVDWGDLPDTAVRGRGTTDPATDNGAAHVLSGAAFMGKCVDAESGTQPNCGCIGDDTSVTTRG